MISKSNHIKSIMLIFAILFISSCETKKTDNSSTTAIAVLAASGSSTSRSSSATGSTATSFTITCSSVTNGITLTAGTAMTSVNCYASNSLSATYTISPALPSGLTLTAGSTNHCDHYRDTDCRFC
ncbi:MAG: hypothetical protein IPH52_07365 [Leptospiraceae bacterium]|nr:hypothetical protein [Leptospiraceae bacterium]